MRRLLSRTSITLDEAVWISLGHASGPVEIEPIDDNEEAEANYPAFSLDILEDERDVLEGEYDLAKFEKQSADVVAEKLAALQRHEEIIEQANVHLCAIRDELNKGEQSVLKVDSALSNAAYTYITLHSFHEWVKCREGAAGGQSGAAEPAGSPPVGTEDATKPKPRTKLREQEDAILVEIRRQGLDPVALPRNPSGKSGVKAAIRVALKNSPLFKGRTTFAKAWERLSKDGRIAHEA